MRQTTFTKSKISYLGSFGLQGAMFVLARGASARKFFFVSVQDDTSHCSFVSVDMKTKVLFQYMLLILKHNFRFKFNGTKRTA